MEIKVEDLQRLAGFVVKRLRSQTHLQLLLAKLLYDSCWFNQGQEMMSRFGFIIHFRSELRDIGNLRNKNVFS